MSALRRASCRPGIVTSAGFGFGIGLAPVPRESAGFAVDLERVLPEWPRRALPVEPYRPGPYARRARGRWPRSTFPLPSAARIWLRDKGRRR